MKPEAWRIMMMLEVRQRGWLVSPHPASDFEIQMDARHYHGRHQAIRHIECPPSIRTHDGEFYLAFASEGDRVMFEISCP